MYYHIFTFTILRAQCMDSLPVSINPLSFLDNGTSKFLFPLALLWLLGILFDCPNSKV